MSSFAISQAIYSSSGSSYKLKKELSLDTSITSTKRGLSLVSPREKQVSKLSSERIIQKRLTNESSEGAKFQFFKCTVPTCNIKTLSLQEEQMVLKPKKLISHNLRLRQTNISSKGVMDCYSSTQDSFCSSKVTKLWSIQSPINKLL